MGPSSSHLRLPLMFRLVGFNYSIVIIKTASKLSSTDLTPFSNSETTFWASSETTDTAKLGYTYPEFNGLDLGNAQAVEQAIGNIVNRLYGSSIFGSFAATAAPEFLGVGTVASLAAGVPVEKSAAPHTPAPSAPAPQPAAPTTRAAPPSGAVHAAVQPHAEPQVHVSAGGHLPAHGHGFYDWTARIEFKKYEFGTSFTVLLFLGPVPEDTEQWLVSPNFVGAHHAFVNSAAGHCANCRNQGDVTVEGFVHLTKYISQHAGLPSLNPDVIEPYLTKELHWRVLKVCLLFFTPLPLSLCNQLITYSLDGWICRSTRIS